MCNYQIEKKVLFRFDELTLSSDELNVQISLGYSTSRCLKTLLDAQGEIVLHETLLQDGWGSQGYVVSPNSLRQAINLLRKALVQAGLPESFITNVPRAGYKISRDFHIEVLNTSHHSPAAQSDLEIANTEQTHVEPSAANSTSLSDITTSNAVGGSVKAVIKKRFIYLLSAILIATISSVIYFVSERMSLLSLLQIKPFQITYLPFGKTKEGHELYFNRSLQGRTVFLEKSKEHLNLDVYLIKKMQTNDSKYVYINGSARDDVYSYFICPQQIEVSSQHCFSFTALEGSL